MILRAIVQLALHLTWASPPAEQKVDTQQYQLHLRQVVRCVPAANAPTSGPDRTWVGFAVDIRSKTPGLFVTPRDFSLEKQGIVVAARHVNPPVLQGCLPLLRPKQLRSGDPHRGVVLFEVPARLRQGDGPLVVAYRPTRWGGARRVELLVPSCLDRCDPPRTPERQARENRRPPVKSTR